MFLVRQLGVWVSSVYVLEQNVHQFIPYRVGENVPPPTVFSQNNHKVMSRYIFIVTMDYVDKSDVEVFTMKPWMGAFHRWGKAPPWHKFNFC